MRYLLCALLLSGCALRQWEPTDTRWAAATTVAIGADCASTAHGLARGATEGNPLLGPTPTPARLWVTCAAGTALVVSVGSQLKPEDRRFLWRVVTSLEVLVVLWNTRVLR